MLPGCPGRAQAGLGKAGWVHGSVPAPAGLSQPPLLGNQSGELEITFIPTNAMTRAWERGKGMGRMGMRLMNPAGLPLRASPRTGYGWGTAALFPRCPGLLGTSTRWHMLKPLQHALQGANHSAREVSKMQAAMSQGVPIPHLTPWSLSHMGPCGGAVHFGERTADISIQTPPDQPAASLAGRTSCLVGLCSGSPTEQLAWGCCGHSSSYQQTRGSRQPRESTRERSGFGPLKGGPGPWSPSLTLPNPGTTWLWGCFVCLMEVRFLRLFFTDTSQGPPNTQNIRA